MTSHPDPSLLTALLRDREREAVASSEEVARLRAEVERLRARDARTTKRWENAECVLGYYKGLPIDRIVRERDESDILLTLAMREGLTECERLRDEVAGLTAERDWLLSRYVDATNCEAEALRIASSAMREGLAECKRLRSDLRTLREHVRWYLEVHKDRPGKQNSRQNEHDREQSKMLLWQWVRLGKLCDGIDTPLADDEKLWAVVEAAREVMTARDEVSGGTWGFLVMAEDRLREALARLDGGP